jgi:hypothetical protein
MDRIDQLLFQAETYTGWLLLENRIEKQQTAHTEQGLPLSRFPFNWEDNQLLPVSAGELSLEAIAQLDPIKKKNLEAQCDRRMHAVRKTLLASSKDTAQLAEYLYSHLFAEARETGTVNLSDYSALLQLEILNGRISTQEYFMVAFFLNLKALVLDKKKNQLTMEKLAKNAGLLIVHPLLMMLSTTAASVPVNLISKLILDSAEKDTEELKAMNFDYFKRYYSHLSRYQPDELAIRLKEHENYQRLLDIFNSLNGCFS